MNKTAVKFIAGALILCMLLWNMNRVLAVKYDDGIYSMTKFYELEENTVDVLVLGSSHAYMSFNTGVLWREQGISSYLLTASSQPLWNSYYYLKEALKTQKPKLIVLEGFRLMEEEEFLSAGFVIKSTYGLKWSQNRIDAIKASVPQEQWLGYLLGYTQYHDRYGELSEEDFTFGKEAEKYADWKGFEMGMATLSLEQPDFGTCTGSLPLMEKTEKYYRAILELAKENDIPIMVVIAPYGGMTQEDQKRFRTAEEIAREYQAPFYNYNLTGDIQIDYGTDMYNTSHLNGRGSRKFASKWGEYIAGQYEIPDHRGDPAYDSWERDAEYLYALLEDVELRETADASLMPEALVRENYHVFLSIDGYCQLDEAAVESVLDGLGISGAQDGGLWYFAGGDRVVWSSGSGEASQYFETERHDFGLKRTQRPDGGWDNEIMIDNQRYRTVENGINVVVFDSVTGIVADSFGIDADNEYQLCR